jgi:hypothetical protein
VCLASAKNNQRSIDIEIPERIKAHKENISKLFIGTKYGRATKRAANIHKDKNNFLNFRECLLPI